MKIQARDHAGLRLELAEGETLDLLDGAGRPFGLAGRRVITLCRCGRSRNKPFCDSSHNEGFDSVCAARDLPPSSARIRQAALAASRLVGDPGEGRPMTAHQPLELECKYVLPAHLAAAAAIVLRGAARAERPHGSGTVESIYFDDPYGSALEEKRASDFHKCKTRLRWYDGDGPVFLEVKRRHGGRREKRRAIVPLDGARLTREGLGALGGVSLARWSARLGEPLAEALAPVLHLRYRRARFVAPGGTRLCLDDRIEALAAAISFVPAARRRSPLAEAVCEVKAAARDLPDIVAPLAALGVRRASFSKYAACLDALAPGGLAR